MFEFPTNSEIQVDVVEVANLAHQVVSQCIGMGVAFIEADRSGFFVYKDPFYDDVRPDRISGDSRKEARLSKEPSQMMWDQEEDKEDKDDKKRGSLKSLKKRQTLHGRLDRLLSSHDSGISLFSRKFSYVFADFIHRVSTTSKETSRRSTYENIIFRHKSKQSEQEQLWNYAMSDSSTSTNSSEDIANLEKEEMELLKHVVYDLQTIEDFDLTTTVNIIREFVALWKVSPTTRFAVLKDVSETATVLGNSYRVTVAFSQPTKMCPNPLAVAHVYFHINYSFVMPTNYPVMITYQFETYKHRFWIMGNRNMRSITFQNYYIESILKAKLSFYIKIFETTYGPLDQAPQELSVDEEYEMFNAQHEINVKLAEPTFSLSRARRTTDIKEEDFQSITKKHMSLINIMRDKTFSLMIIKEEPWKIGFINAETVENVNLNIKHEAVEITEKIEDGPMQELSLFNLNVYQKPSDIFLHN